jgi:hypothetical protein
MSLSTPFNPVVSPGYRTILGLLGPHRDSTCASKHSAGLVVVAGQSSVVDCSEHRGRVLRRREGGTSYCRARPANCAAGGSPKARGSERLVEFWTTLAKHVSLLHNSTLLSHRAGRKPWKTSRCSSGCAPKHIEFTPALESSKTRSAPLVPPRRLGLRGRLGDSLPRC